MRARRFIYELFIAGPIFLMAYFAVASRIGVSTFQTPSYSNELNARILSYRDPVCAVAAYSKNPDMHERPVQIRRAADLWIRLGREGSLRPLHMEYRYDSTREGVKSQIRGAGQRLSGDLARLGQEIAKNDPERGVQYCLDAVEICQILKFSDPFSIGYFSAKEKAILGVASRMEPGVTAKMRTRLIALLERTIAQKQQFAHVLEQAESLVKIELAQRGESAAAASNLFDGTSAERTVLALSNTEIERENTLTMIAGGQFARSAFEGELKFARELLSSLKRRD